MYAYVSEVRAKVGPTPPRLGTTLAVFLDKPFLLSNTIGAYYLIQMGLVVFDTTMACCVVCYLVDSHSNWLSKDLT